MKNLLTKQCKTDFEAWFSIDLENEKGLIDTQIKHVRMNKLYMFNSINLSMQFGVYQDFFQSKDIVFSFKYNGYSFDEHRYRGQIIAFTDGKGEREVIKSNSLNDMRKNLISTSNKLYNEKHKKS